MINRKFKVRTAWVNDNAFCVRVEEYKRVPRFLLSDIWEEVEVYRYASWESMWETVWLKHMLSGESLWEINTEI